MKVNSNLKIAVMGLGYVGLPLFMELSKNLMFMDLIRINKKLKI